MVKEIMAPSQPLHLFMVKLQTLIFYLVVDFRNEW